MSNFKELEQAYLDCVKASAVELQGSDNSQAAAGQQGFGEAAQSFSYSESGHAIDAAETSCLAYEIRGIEDLQPKIEFILRQMRQLTDETEEFDAYAERLLADIKQATVSRHD